MAGYSIPAFFPSNCSEWIKERLEPHGWTPEVVQSDIKVLLNPELHSHWNDLHQQRQSDIAFEKLFIMASVHKWDCDEHTAPDILIGHYTKILGLAEKLSKALTQNSQIAHNLNNGTFYLIKAIVMAASPLSAAGEIRKLFTSKNPHPFNKGLPTISAILLALADQAREKISEVRSFKNEFLPTKLRAKTAPRTAGVIYMASIATDKSLFKKPRWEALADILSALHKEHEAFDSNTVMKIWKESQKTNKEGSH
jgi:hypothetical protein